MRKHNDEQVIKGYNTRAENYDFRFEGQKGKLLDYFQKRALLNLLQSQKIPKNARILEVGCGSGRFLEFLEWNGYTKLYGIDTSSNMISITSQKTNNVRLQVGNAYKIPFETGKFDFVFSVHVLMHIDNPKKMLNEMKRVTKKDGYLMIDINDKHSPFSLLVRLWRIFQTKKKHFPQMYSISNIEKLLIRDVLTYSPTYFLPVNIPKSMQKSFNWYLKIVEKLTYFLNKTDAKCLSTQKFLLFKI
jgi:ubiquinone/menaquinone biosynthesis C-methylase UbiE